MHDDLATVPGMLHVGRHPGPDDIPLDRPWVLRIQTEPGALGQLLPDGTQATWRVAASPSCRGGRDVALAEIPADRAATEQAVTVPAGWLQRGPYSLLAGVGFFDDDGSGVWQAVGMISGPSVTVGPAPASTGIRPAGVGG